MLSVCVETGASGATGCSGCSGCKMGFLLLINGAGILLGNLTNWVTDGVVCLIGLIVAANIWKLGVCPPRVLSGEIVLRPSGFLLGVVLLVVVDVVVVEVVVVDAVVLLVVVVTALSSLRVVIFNKGALDDCDLKTSSGLDRGLLVEITLGSAKCLVPVLV